MESGGTSQNTERIQLSKGHSRTGDGIGRAKSGHGKGPTSQRVLTNWRRCREGQVRTRKESDRASGTHILETALGGTSQDAERIRPSKGHSHPGDQIGRASQNTQRIRPSKGHSHPGDGIGRDKSGHGKNPTGREALTSCRRHREGQVRTQKGSDRARGTHILETASEGQVRTRKESDQVRGTTHSLESESGGTSQNTERIRPSEGHPLSGDDIGRDKSGYEKNPIEREALTFWRLASGVTSQDTQRIRPSKGDSHSGDGRGRDKSGHAKKPTERGHSHPGDSIGRDKSGHGKNSTERGALTNWRPNRDRQVRRWKESDRARATHILETASEGTSQDTERIQLSEGHSRTGDRIRSDISGRGKDPTEWGALTSWRRYREDQVRTRNGSDRARGTHILETASGGTSQNMERIRPSEWHLRSGDGIRKDTSGHGKNRTERGALTLWRWHREGQVRTWNERIRPSKGHSPARDGTERNKSKHGKKSGRNYNIRHKEEETDNILVVKFQQQVTI